MTELPASVSTLKDLRKVDLSGANLTDIVTNGVMRDLGDMPDDFPVLAGSIGPSHGFVHIREIGTPVTAFDPKTVRRDKPPDNPEVRKEMKAIANKRRRFGYRRIGVMLERKGMIMNHKKLYRLYTEEKPGVRRRRGKNGRVDRARRCQWRYGRASAGRWTFCQTRLVRRASSAFWQ